MFERWPRASTQAQLRLGQLYERGEGVLQNFAEAVRWFSVPRIRAP